MTEDARDAALQEACQYLVWCLEDALTPDREARLDAFLDAHGWGDLCIRAETGELT